MEQRLGSTSLSKFYQSSNWARSLSIRLDHTERSDWKHRKLRSEILKDPLGITQAFQQACKDKGRGSVRVSWTKGHTFFCALPNGTVSLKAAIHNSIADKAADYGSYTTLAHARADLLLYFEGK